MTIKNLINLYVWSLFGQGWFIVFFKLIGFSHQFNIVLIFSYFILLLIIFKVFYANIKSFNFIFLGFLILILILIFFKTSIQIKSINSFYSLFRIFNYVAPLFLFLAVSKLSYKDQNLLIKIIFNLSFLSILIGIIQFLFSRYLPTELLDPPLLNSISHNTIFYIGTDFFHKPTGFIGNPIEFGVFISFLFSIFIINDYRIKFKMLYLILAIIVIFMSVSRIAIGLALFALLLKYPKRIIIFLSLIVLPLNSFIAYYSNEFLFINHVIERISGNDASAQNSNSEHLKDAAEVIKIILDSPILGIPIGNSSMENEIITDGAWLKILLEFGIPLFLLYIFLFLYPYIYLIYMKKYSLNLLIFILFILVANSFNSAFFNKVVYSNFWIFYSIMISNNLRSLDKLNKSDVQ